MDTGVQFEVQNEASERASYVAVGIHTNLWNRISCAIVA